MKKLISALVVVLVGSWFLAGCARNNVVEHLDKTEVDSFKSMNLDIDVAKVDVIPTGDEFAIEYNLMNQEVEYSVKNDVLTFEADTIDKWGIENSENCYVKIYVPEDYEMEKFECECAVGSVNINDISANKISINCDVCDVDLKDVLVNTNLKVTSAVGVTDIKLANDDFSYAVKSDLGSISVKGNSCAGFEIMKKHTVKDGPMVDVSSNTGRIKIA